jgi:MYND finger
MMQSIVIPDLRQEALVHIIKTLSFCKCDNRDCNNREPTHILKLCSRCKYAVYCSKECQVASWSRHKEHCTRVASQPRTQRESIEAAD